jgi:hypothetical protein
MLVAQVAGLLASKRALLARMWGVRHSRRTVPHSLHGGTGTLGILMVRRAAHPATSICWRRAVKCPTALASSAAAG